MLCATKNKTTMKDELIKYYSTLVDEFKNIVEKFPKDDIAGPLLLCPNNKYLNQKKRLMIIGQQTNGWEYFDDNIDKLIQTYLDFDLGSDYYSSPFWNITRKLEIALGNEEYSCIWTNLNKFDLDANRPYGEYEIEISKLDKMLIKEIEILKPDICIFFTGPSFDNRIKNIFADIEFLNVNDWEYGQLSQLKHKNLPNFSYRTHHPKSLRIRYLEDDFIDCISTIVQSNSDKS